MASSSTAAAYSPSSSNESYQIFINHHGADVRKTLASHLYHGLFSAHGLRVFLDKPQLQPGEDFPFQIKDAVRTASVHVAIFSAGYAESELCLNELLLMLETKAPIILVFYHVDPAELSQTQGKGMYAEALRKLEEKKTNDPHTHQEKPRHDATTIQKWREALSTVSKISGLDLQGDCNGDEGELVEKIVQRVLEKLKSKSEFYYSEPYRSRIYGGSGGGEWTDGTYSGVRRITMTANEYSLTSLQLRYGLDGDESLTGRSISGDQHGGVIGNPHLGLLGDRIEYNLNYPEEIITKISGHFGSYKPWPESWVVIKSLTFHTNKGMYGPCGQERGTYFETEEEGKIVGFFGSSGTLLDSIGVYMLKPRTSDDEASEYGEKKWFHRSQLNGCPWGLEWNDGTYSGIRRITMTLKNKLLTSVQLTYGLDGDESVKDIFFFGLRHGVADGAPVQFKLLYPEEFVTKISGYYGSYKSCDVIKSLTFYTNLRKLGPCGRERGTHFETEERGKIVGIFGSSGALLDSIGVYYMLKPRISTENEFCRSQPYGGFGGDYWNDGTYSGIRRITMTSKDNRLASVQLTYGMEGDESVKDKYFLGLRHGGAGSARTEYNLKYPEEIVTKISGYFGTYGPHKVIISLTFHTNQRTLGPCGHEGGPYFETEEEGKIVGVFGSSGDVVDSIGVYMVKPRTWKHGVKVIENQERGNMK